MRIRSLSFCILVAFLTIEVAAKELAGWGGFGEKSDRRILTELEHRLLLDGDPFFLQRHCGYLKEFEKYPF